MLLSPLKYHKSNHANVQQLSNEQLNTVTQCENSQRDEHN